MTDLGPMYDALNWAKQDDGPPRLYLGGSVIGDECARKNWLRFRALAVDSFSARTRLTFNLGHKVEALLIDTLNSIPGVTLVDKIPHSKRQFGFSEFGGHFRGHMDGIIKAPDLLPTPDWHLWECKSLNAQSFKKMMDNGVEATNPTYYGQLQVYLDTGVCQSRGISAALFTAMNKDTSDIYFEVVPKRGLAVAALKGRAKDIITRSTPPDRIANDPSWFACRWCPVSKVCWGELPPQKKDCRQCKGCKAELGFPDGRWSCNIPEGERYNHHWSGTRPICEAFDPLL